MSYMRPFSLPHLDVDRPNLIFEFQKWSKTTFGHGANQSKIVHYHEMGAVISQIIWLDFLALNALDIATVSWSTFPLEQNCVSCTQIVSLHQPVHFCLKVHPWCKSARPNGWIRNLHGCHLFQQCDTQGPCLSCAQCFILLKIWIGAKTKNFVQHSNILRMLVGESIALDEQALDEQINYTDSS